MTQQPRPGRRKTTTYVAMGLVAAGALTATAYAAQWFEGVWNGRPYPVAAPASTAQRLDARTQAVYDALALPHGALDENWAGGGMDATGYSCHPVGLRHFFDNLSDTPPSEPHVVDVHDNWAVKGVALAEAVTAVERARVALTHQGWKVTEYEHTSSRLVLRLTAPDSSDAVGIEAYPEDRLQVFTTAECARYPEGTPLDSAGDPQLAAPQAPSTLRH
ncbi:hypothetical protein GCM10010331_15230 [Streptomyces xanthochromogenes]|uniref:hypothetical protein n=1 Tax=Streptomyces xanthochromogenes TaxID=67384 RepID=UPI00167A9B91|nr:hypothetical protein [Streptomyces xanthochromogenes]GHB29825.1 hypothetical protein GCM10010331_15230 [Streptomyces xanthochromogenes]